MPAPFPSPIPHIEGGYQIQMKGTAFELPVENVFHMVSQGGTPNPTAAEMAALWIGAWTLFASEVFHTSYVCAQVGVYDLSEAEGVEHIVSTSIAGGKTGDPTPPGTCVLLTHHTNVRKKRGLTYLGAVPRSVVVDAGWTELTPDGVTLYNTSWLTLLDTVTTGSPWSTNGGAMAVLSRQTNKAPDVRLINIDNTSVGRPLSSLRRRRLRG